MRHIDPDEGLARRVPRVDLVVEEVAVGVGEAEAGAVGTAVGIVEPVDRGREADEHREVLQVLAAGVAGDGEHELLREGRRDERRGGVVELDLVDLEAIAAIVRRAGIAVLLVGMRVDELVEANLGRRPPRLVRAGVKHRPVHAVVGALEGPGVRRALGLVRAAVAGVADAVGVHGRRRVERIVDVHGRVGRRVAAHAAVGGIRPAVVKAAGH